MKVLMINGSPRKEGNTHLALAEVAKVLSNSGVEYEVIHIGTKAVQGCIACGKCRETGRCAFDDELYNKVRRSLETSDALVIGSPVYYAGPNGSLCALLDRVFYSSRSLLTHKPGAAIAVCRRGGATAALDRLNKYFTVSHMPLVPSQYWNMVHGRLKGEVAEDGEGMQAMRALGRNMVWLLTNLKTGTHAIPEAEEPIMTNFIR